VAALPFVAEFTGYEYGWLLLAALFVGMVAYRTSIEVLKSTERFGLSTWLEASRDTSRVIVQVALVTAGLGVAGMVGGMVLANLLLAPVVFYLLGTRPWLPTLGTVRRIWDYARFSIRAALSAPPSPAWTSSSWASSSVPASRVTTRWHSS